MPRDRFRLGNTRADLRLRIEQLLQRKEAAPDEAWAKLGPEARDLLVEMLDDEAVRSEKAILHRVISVLGQLRVKVGIAPLGAIVTDASETSITRAYAANALGRLGEPAAIDSLVEAATVKDDMVRRQVAMALGRIDRDTVVPHLLKLRKDPSVAVAEVASEAVGRWEIKLARPAGRKKRTAAKQVGKTAKVRGKKSPHPER